MFISNVHNLQTLCRLVLHGSTDAVLVMQAVTGCLTTIAALKDDDRNVCTDNVTKGSLPISGTHLDVLDDDIGGKRLVSPMNNDGFCQRGDG